MHGGGVVRNAAGREVRYQLVVFKLVEREAVSRLVVVLVALHVGNDTRIYLQLDVAHIVCPLLVLVHLLKLQSGDATGRNHLGTQHVGDQCDDGGRNHVGHHQALEAHSGGEHGDNLGVLCQLRREENHGNEYEQRTEEVRVIRNEVQVIVEDDGTDRRLVVDEVVNVFIDVEHHGDGDNQGDGKKVGAQELHDDVPVQPFQPFLLERVSF